MALTLAVATLMLLVPTGASAAPPPPLSQFCEGGSGAGQCSGSLGIATDPVSGNIYAIDNQNRRINKFTIWGQFIEAFGGGVVNGGATGIGTLGAGSTIVSAVSTTTKAFVPGMAIEGTGIAPATTIASVDNSTLTLSRPATAAATGAATALTSPEAAGNVPTNELQRITVTATAGAFKLRFRTPLPADFVGQTTTSLPYNAAAAEVQSALEALSNIGAGNVAVTSANPGGEAGVPGGPYTVEFKGARFADTNVGGLIADPGTPPLSGGGAEVAPVRQGASAPEVCSGLDCRQGVDGANAGQFASLRGLAVDSTGNLYVYESPTCTGGEACVEHFGYAKIGPNRVQKFDSEGNFLLMLGGGVNQGGGTPSNPGNVCTAQHIANGDTCGGGKSGTGNGQFGTGSLSLLDRGYGVIATAPGNTIYVGGDGRVQQFKDDGTFLKSIPLSGQMVTALAVDPASGNLYLARVGKADVLKLSPVGTTLATLPVKEPVGLATDVAGNLYVIDGSTKLNGEIELRKFTSAGAEVPSFAFHDGFNGSTGIATSSACGIEGSDLYVANAAALNSFIRAYGPPPNPTLCPPPPLAPEIATQYASSADSEAATLRAGINPHFWPDATYYVQYGTGKCSAGGCEDEQPVPPGTKLTTATTSRNITTAGVLLGGLKPATTYHYRFVAQSSGGGPVRGVGGEVGKDGAEGTFTTFPAPVEANTDCANQGFRIAASAKLPDCRAYEMVSPVDKNGGDVTMQPVSNSYGSLAESAAGGDRATFSSLRSFADPLAAPLISQYLSVRGPGGWSARSISPSRANPPIYGPGTAGQFKAFSDNLCSAWIMQDADMALAPGAPAGVTSIYRRGSCEEDSYELITHVAPPGFGPGEINREIYLPAPQGHSDDETRTVYRADAALTPDACSTAGIFQVYEASRQGPLRLISVLPNGSATCSHATVGTTGVASDGFSESSVHRAVSADGSRVFWTDSGDSKSITESQAVGVGPGKLYVRIDATEEPSAVEEVAPSKFHCTEAGKACTLAISEAGNTQYWSADREGKVAIYTVGNGPLGELFEFDVEEAKSQLIAKGVQSVVGASEDASRIYFVSTNVLSGSQKNSQGDIAQVGKANLYLAEAGAFVFVATLGDEEGDAYLNQRLPSSPGNVQPQFRTSRISPDGLHLAFTSAEELSGYDNTDVLSGEPDAELYLYDADGSGGAGQLACVSCNPSGVRPSGREALKIKSGTVSLWAAALLPGWSEQLHPSRLLADDGSRLYFESFDALVLADTNGKKDVYEWERAAGKAECEEAGAGVFSAGSGGCLSLISSGQSPEESELIDASNGGGGVFFATAESLLPQDPGLIDLYDARVLGGFPPPESPPPSCEGEACQGPVSSPNDPTPASSSLEGAGNVREGRNHKPRCGKGKVRRKGHCVAKHKERHAEKKRADHKRRAGR
jgi:hypothetical protein